MGIAPMDAASPKPGSSLSVGMPESGPEGVRFSGGRRARRGRFGIWTYEDPRGAWWYAQRGWVQVTHAQGGSRAGPRPTAPPKRGATKFFDVVDSVWTTRDPRSPFFYARGSWIGIDELDEWIHQQLGLPPQATPGAHGAATSQGPTTTGAEPGDDTLILGLRPLLWLARASDRRGLAQLIDFAERLLLFFLSNRRGLENERGYSVIFPCSGVAAPWTLPTTEVPKPDAGRQTGRVPAWMDDPAVALAKDALALIGALQLLAAKRLDATSPSRGTWALLARVHRLLVANRTWTEARSDPAGSPALWLASEAVWAIRHVAYPAYPAKGACLFGPLRRADLHLRALASRADVEAVKYFATYRGRPPADWLRWSSGCPTGAGGTCASCAGSKPASGSIASLWPNACPCSKDAKPSACSGCARGQGAAASSGEAIPSVPFQAQSPLHAEARTMGRPRKAVLESSCQASGRCGSGIGSQHPDDLQQRRRL